MSFHEPYSIILAIPTQHIGFKTDSRPCLSAPGTNHPLRHRRGPATLEPDETPVLPFVLSFPPPFPLGISRMDSPSFFAGCGVGPTYLFLLLRPAWRFPSLAAFRQAERTVPISHCPLAFNHKSIQVFMSPAHFSEALAFSSFAAPARFVNSGIIRSSRWYVV